MTTYKSIDDVIKEIEHWIRLSSLLHSGLKGTLLDVLHNTQKDPSYTGLSRDSTDLYKELDTIHKVTLTSLKDKKRIISREQWDSLFPATGKTESDSFDVTLITVLIINRTNLKPPLTGWDHRKLLATDNSKSANVLRCREWRNYVHHTDPRDIDYVTFINKWTEAENIIKSLGYQFNTNQLMNISLDPKTSQQHQLVLKVLNHFCTKEVKEHDDSIKKMQKELSKLIKLKLDGHDLVLQTHKDILDDHDTEIETHEVKLDEHDGKIETHQVKLDEHDGKIETHQVELDEHDGRIETQQVKLDEHDDKIETHQVKLDEHAGKIETHQVKLDEHDDKIETHQVKLDEHAGKIETHQVKLDEHDDKIEAHQVKLDEHDGKIETHQAKLDEHDGKIEKQEREIHKLKTQVNTSKGLREEIQCTEDLKKMKVISYMAFGCIFKLQVERGFEIESVNIKCISAKDGCDWMHVEQYNNVNSSDECEDLYYEVKELDEETILLKIENLDDRKKYRIQLQTNLGIYSDETTIYGQDSCAHVTNVDDTFIVLTPPLGQFNDPQTCRHGLRGYFIEDSCQLTTRMSDGAQIHTMTVKEFSKFSDAYRIRNFPNNKIVLQFPPLYISDPVIKQVANLFYQLLFDRHGFRAVVTNLDSNKYFKCCTKTDDNLQVELPYLNRILVFDEKTESVLNIRVLQQATNFDSVVHKEMENCITDMQYFVAAHRHNSCCCYVIGILAFPNICRADLKSQLSYYFSKQKQLLMNLFYLSKDDLEDHHSLQQWWTDVFEIEVKRLSKPNFKVDSFQCICSQSMCTIALAELSPKRPTRPTLLPELSAKLPTLLSDTHLQINSLLLNPNQVNAIQTISNRKIIIGSFGTGKSVILDEIAKRKFRECLHTEKKTLLLYVVWEAYSLLEIQKNLFLDNLINGEPNYSPHLTMISGNVHGLWAEIKNGQPISLLRFLQYYFEESNFEILHILIDELPTDAVHVTELERLNELLSRDPNSSVAIAPQSIVIDRTTSTETEEKNHNCNCLDKIKMDQFHLMKVMRNSKEVTAALKASQDKLHGTETVLNLYDFKAAKDGLLTMFKKKVNHGVSRFMSVFTTQQAPNSPLNVTEEQIEPTDPETEVATATQSKKAVTEPPIELEKISKLMDTEEKKKKATSQLKTTYQFHPIENGNGVTDQKPTLIKLSSQVDFESDMSAKILLLTLKELCLQKSSQTVMLCSSMEEIRMVSYCLSLIPNFKFVTYIPQLQGVFPTIEERNSVFSAFNDGSCLLTDNTGIKGMEAKRVIVIVQRDEYFESHLLNETMSRANVWAYILLRTPTLTVKKKRKTLGDIFEEVETLRLFNVKQVTLYEDHSNFDTPFSNEDDRIFKVNKICPLNLHGLPTFDAYRTSFDREFPGYQTIENYRTKLQELTSFQYEGKTMNLQYEGKTFSFYELKNLLKYKSLRDKFNAIIASKPYLTKLRNNDNETLLHMAAKYGATECVEVLIKNGCDVKEKDNVGWMAIHRAAGNGRTQVMKILLSHDPTLINIKTNIYNETPLHGAAYGNHREMVELLLSQPSVDVNARDSIYGRTPDEMADVNDVLRVNDQIKGMIRSHRNYSTSIDD